LFRTRDFDDVGDFAFSEIFVRISGLAPDRRDLKT